MGYLVMVVVVVMVMVMIITMGDTDDSDCDDEGDSFSDSYGEGDIDVESDGNRNISPTHMFNDEYEVMNYPQQRTATSMTYRVSHLPLFLRTSRLCSTSPA
jgi:hypothetical protein